MKRSRRAANPDWKQLLLLTQALSNLDTPEQQRKLLEEKSSLMLSAQVKVWLACPPYPPCGETEGENFPNPSSPALALEAFHRARIVLPDPQPEDTPPYIMALPLAGSTAILGALLAERHDTRFTDAEIQFAEGLSVYAGLALEAKRLEALKNWHFEQLNLVRSVAAQIASLPRQNDLYEKVTRLIQDTFEYDYVAIFIRSDKERVLEFRGSSAQQSSGAQKTATILPDGFIVQFGEGIIGTVGETGVEIVASDVQAHPQYRFMEVLAGTRSEATLPLKVENHILGVLDFQSTRIDDFQESDMLVLRTLADHIALAIESKYLSRRLEHRAEQISTVFDISHAITSILDMDQLFDAVVKLIQNRFGYPFVHAYTVHPGRKLVIYQTGIGERSEAIKKKGLNYPLDAPQGIIPWVARNGKPFLSNDVTCEPLYIPSDVPPYDTCSELAIPLIHGDEVLGVLDLQSRACYAFDDNDISLFEALAAPIAVALRNATLYRSEQWRRKVAESFRDVAQLISSNLPLNQLLNIILEKLDGNLPCDASAIWLLEDGLDTAAHEGQHHLRLAATRNIQSERIFETLQDPRTQEILEKSLEADLPLIRRQGDPYDPLGVALQLSSNYSSIAAPMRTNNRPLGIITLVHNQDGRYGSEAQAITATFASYAAVAIQNARLYNETQEQAFISTMLLQISEASQTIMTIDDLLATMIRLTRLLVGVRKCAFLLWEENQQSFQLRSWYGFEPEGDKTRLFSAQLPGFALIADNRSTLYIDDPAYQLNLPEISLESGTIVMLPLIIRGNVTGAFLVGLQMAWESGIETGFDPKALSILQGIAHQVSLTIDNLRLLEGRQEEAYVTAALLQVAQAVVSSTDLNDTLDTIVHLLPILMGINTCIIYLWDATNQLFRPTQVYAGNRKAEDLIIGRAFAPGEYPLLDAIRQKGEMHLCQIPEPGMSFQEWTGLPCLIFDEINSQASLPQGDWLLGYPLSLQEQVFGVLLARETNTSPSFLERRMEILNGIAQQVSMAIQNDVYKQEMVQTERIEREVQLARQIQETFLPDPLPPIRHWEIDLRWETAREVGGDFYDFFKLSDNRIGLVIADVSDKGLPAALYMTVARTLIRANAFTGQSPAEALLEANRLLISDSKDAMFITAIYAILDLETGELTYTNAGHNRPLLYRWKGKWLEQLPKGGTALGVLDDLKLENHHLVIQPGDALVLFTDGVTDTMSTTGEFFGDHRLQQLLQQHGGELIHDMLEYLDDELLEFRRGLAPIDDVTLLAIRREPTRRRGARKIPNASASGPNAAKS